MLSVSALSKAQVTAVFSPSKHPFMRRINARRFCFDPYKGIIGKTIAVSTPLRSPLRSPMGIRSPNAVSMASTPSTASMKLSPQCSPVAPPAAPKPKTHYVTVEFKKTTGVFRAPFRVAIGDLVVVEGDRGENIGTIKVITTDKPTEEIKVKVLRRASATDREALAEKTEKEDKIMEEVKKAATSARLNATVLDVEFQFDMKKLTIFVERATSSTFVDFRKLQRILFRQFRCRIWCVYTDEI